MPGPRYVVCLPSTSTSSWELEPFVEVPCRSGGARTLHELAVAIAATGPAVEVRGGFESAELQRLGSAAGVFPYQPHQSRCPGSRDVVVLPEGLPDPLMFAASAVSGARIILLALAPPGLFGWSFDAGWRSTSPGKIDPAAVGRPEHLRAIRALGFELWTHMPQLVREAEAAGVRCVFIGNGRPVPYPDPPDKRYDVATLRENRWSGLPARVADDLGPGLSRLDVPGGDNATVIAGIGSARILIHPSRIEGHSRLAQEARAVGTIPVGLSSNRYAVGLDEDHGGLAVSSLEAMPATIHGLLASPERLAELSRRGAQTARAQVDWGRFVSRVDAALSAPAPADPGRRARSEIGAHVRRHRQALLQDLADARAARAEAESAQVLAEAARAHAEERLREVLATRAWRAVTTGWRVRDRLRRPWRAYSRR